MGMQIMVGPLTALIAGVFVLIMPRFLHYIVAAWLILTGLTGLLPHLRGGAIMSPGDRGRDQPNAVTIHSS